MIIFLLSFHGTRIAALKGFIWAEFEYWIAISENSDSLTTDGYVLSLLKSNIWQKRRFNLLQCKTRGQCLCLPVCCTWSLLRQPFYSSEEFFVKSTTRCFYATPKDKYSTMRLAVPIKRSHIKMKIGYRWAEMFLFEILCLQQGCLFYLFTQNINFLTHHHSVASIRKILKSDFTVSTILIK